MAILYVGIDLAKSVFTVHGVNEAGRPELVRPSVARARLHELVASLPPCTIGMRPAPARTTEQGCSSSTATQCG